MKRTVKRSASNEDDVDSTPISPSSATPPSVGPVEVDSLGTTLLSSISSFSSLPIAVSAAAAAAMSELVIPFGQPQAPAADEPLPTNSHNPLPNNDQMRPKVSTSSMDSQEWLRAAQLHEYSHNSLREAEEHGEFGGGGVTGVGSFRHLSGHRHHSSESEDHESVMDFDINQLEDSHVYHQHSTNGDGRSHSSPNSSGLDILADVSEAESDDRRKQSWRHLCAHPSSGLIIPNSWIASEEVVTPAILEKVRITCFICIDVHWL